MPQVATVAKVTCVDPHCDRCSFRDDCPATRIFEQVPSGGVDAPLVPSKTILAARQSNAEEDGNKLYEDDVRPIRQGFGRRIRPPRCSGGSSRRR